MRVSCGAGARRRASAGPAAPPEGPGPARRRGAGCASPRSRRTPRPEIRVRHDHQHHGGVREHRREAGRQQRSAPCTIARTRRSIVLKLRKRIVLTISTAGTSMSASAGSASCAIVQPRRVREDRRGRDASRPPGSACRRSNRLSPRRPGC